MSDKQRVQIEHVGRWMDGSVETEKIVHVWCPLLPIKITHLFLTFNLNHACFSTNLTPLHHFIIEPIFDFRISRPPRLHLRHPLPVVPLCLHQTAHPLLFLSRHLHRWGIRSWRWTDGVSWASHMTRPCECWSLLTIWWWRSRTSGDCRTPVP